MTEEIETIQEAQSDGESMQPEVILDVQDLKVWFELRRLGFGHVGHVHAVDGVSFQLYRGEAIAIVGESGCGKSSLMKTILGLNEITDGKILFENMDLSTMNSKTLRWYRSTQIGYVQQDPYGALPPFMSIQRIIEEPLIVGGMKDKQKRLDRVTKVMEEVRLMPVEDFLNKFPHQISGGQQQRVVIARALIQEPDIIVADEPVSMLDASVRVEVLRLMRALQEEHKISFIYITHDLSTVRYFSEYIFVMYAGMIAEKAKQYDLLTNPKHPYTRALLTATSEPDYENSLGFKEVPPGEPPSLVKPPDGCRFHPRCKYMIEGVCNIEQPPEFFIEEGHQVACWLYDERYETPEFSS
ncbi:MAG: ABC transporter ATP-binding protein [Brevefilum sp.]|jgi:peptide/nickel transport system ATP-binding protein